MLIQFSRSHGSTIAQIGRRVQSLSYTIHMSIGSSYFGEEIEIQLVDLLHNVCIHEDVGLTLADTELCCLSLLSAGRWYEDDDEAADDEY